MESVAVLYINACKTDSVHVNSKVVSDLKKNGETAEEMKHWDLRNTMIGTKGAIVVMNVVKEHLHQLESIDFSGSNIKSPFMKVLLATAVDHNSLKSINLSDNDIRLGGPELIELVKKNNKIVEVFITNTNLGDLFVRLLEKQLKRNAAMVNSPDFRINHINDDDDHNNINNDNINYDDENESPFARTNRMEPFTFEDDEENQDDSSFNGNDSNGKKRVDFEVAGEKSEPKVIFRRATVCSEVYDDEQIDNFKAPLYEKSEEHLNWLISVLEKHELFSHLENYELTVAVNAMPDLYREEGTVLFEQGDEDYGDMWYLVLDGEIELRRDGELIRTLTKGDATDDIVLLYNQPPKETAAFTKASTVYSLDRQTYKFVISQASKKKREMYEGFLNTVGFLRDAKLGKNELLQLADSLKSVSFEDGKALIEYGEIGESFFIILEGTVDIFGRNDDNETVKVCDFTVGDCVGELEFLNNHRCVADVKANGFVRAAKMNRRHFEMVMGPVKEVLARNAGESTVYTYYREQLEKIERERSVLRESIKEDEEEGSPARSPGTES